MTNVVQMKDHIPQEVIIDGFTIKQDSEGRYCLNDIWKASGEDKTDQVSNWLRSDKTANLIENLTPQNRGIKPLDVKAGRYGGTYAVKELVYAYAMWISAEYHLKVIRAYDRLATDGVTVHENSAEAFLKNPTPFMKIMVEHAERLEAEKLKAEKERDVALAENEILAEKIEEDRPKVNYYETVTSTDDVHDLAAAAQILGTGQNRLTAALRSIGVFKPKKPLPYQRYIDVGYFVVDQYDFYDAHGRIRIGETAKVTGKGMIFLQKKLASMQEAA